MTKYGNKKTVVDDLKFDSKKESKRYLELKMLLKTGEITDLELQKPFVLVPSIKLSTGKSERPCKYIADFVFKKDGVVVVEDVKGMRTGSIYALFVIKRKLMKFIHNIEIIET